MHFIDYYEFDEFNIYTTPDDVINYIENLVNQGYDNDEEKVYEMCLSHFGENYIDVINEIFQNDEE